MLNGKLGLPPPKEPLMVLYISCGEESGPGKVYQVDEHGRVLGIVNLPYAGTGIALHQENGLVLALPRDGGRIARIDDSGKLSTILEKQKEIVHPIDVAIAGRSDSVLIADNMADTFSAITALGGTPKLYHRIDGQKYVTQAMSIAITTDKHVLCGTDSPEGVYRYSGDDPSFKNPPLLPSYGGVAADPATLKWAAAQPPNQIYVFEGEELVKKLRLPPAKRFYRQGLLSFAPASTVVVAVRPADEAVGEVWFLQFGVEKNDLNSLFPWDKEPILDFVVGPRMFWDRHDKKPYKSVY